MKRTFFELILLLLAFVFLVACDGGRVAGEAVTAVTVTPVSNREAAPTRTPTSRPTVTETAVSHTPPQILRRTPNERFLTDRRPTIQLTFSRTMDWESVAIALHIEPPLAVSLNGEGAALTISPEQPLAPDAEYEFVLDDTAVDLHGTSLERPFRWEYRLRNLVSAINTPKTDRTSPITIRFNYAMDDESVRKAFKTEPAIVGDLTWNRDKTVATFTPAVPLPANTTYAVHLEGVLRDANGDPFPPLQPFTFTTPPPIVHHTPEGTEVNPLLPVEITFDRPMAEDETAAAFQIQPDLPGALTWEETTLIFTPDAGSLAENGEYTVTVDATAVSADNEVILDEPFTWTFRTGAAPDVVSFGWGPNAQVVDVNGRRAIQYVAESDSVREVTFELYQLDVVQFLDRYASGFRGVAGDENRPVSTEGADLFAEWTIPVKRVDTGYGNVSEMLIPPEAPPGLYILNMVAGHLNDQLIVALTENAITIKQAEGQIVVWVTAINGGPVADIEVGVYARDGELLANGRTGSNGIFETAVTTDPQPLIVIARHGDDVTASGLSNEWRSRNNQWGGWWQPTFAAHDYAAYIYTDRPIYRPGHTVYYKAIVRQDDDAILSMVPAGTLVTVRIRDARNNVVQTFEHTSNNFGTVHGEFQLAAGAMTGNYFIEVALGGESHRQTFKVEDYRKPDYQVTVTTDKERYVAGETVEVTVDTAYFFGEPVLDADVVINLYQLGPNYSWDSSSSDPYVWYDVYDSSRSGRTDENGRFTFTMPAAGGNMEVDWRSSLRHGTRAIEATVDDGSHQTVSGIAVVNVYDAPEKLRLDTGGWSHTPGQPFTIRAELQTIYDEPVNGRTVTLELLRWNREDHDYTTVMQTASLTTGSDGKGETPFTIEEAGFYRLQGRANAPSGQAIIYETYVYAFSSAAGSWYGRNDALNIDADRDSYAPGDTARLLIESGFSGPALLTFERGTTRREQLVELTAPVTLVEVPIQADDAPNIYVTVNAWEEQDTTLSTEREFFVSVADSWLHTASVNLSVPVTDKTLQVTITPDKEIYAPREEATFTVRVTNQAGTPVSAELSLALVDEAIFALSEELSGAMFDAFYHERSNIVATYDTMALRRILLGGYGGGGGGGDLANAPRSDFQDTAAWFPVLQTDFNGEATVTVTLPDNLTNWRLTAKAATADTQVGETTANITTRQDVVVRPILPRTLTAGDQINLSAIVHNYSEAPQTLEVALNANNTQFTIHDAPLQTITLGPGAIQIVGWPVTAVAAGEAELVVRASSDGVVQDAVQLPLSIRPLAVPDVTTEVGQFSGALETAVQMPVEALPTSGVRLELSRSVAGTLLEGLEYLTGFPYGCVEQTMSRALPNAVVGRALFQLGVTDPTLQADLPAKISAGLQRLYGYQHNDGGWGWWYDDSSHDYQTAWVVFGLAVMADAGYEVDGVVIERGVTWLNDNLDSMDPRTRAYALYSMAVAGQPNREATLALAEDPVRLDAFSQAGLALALWESGEEVVARQVVDGLVETAVVTENGYVYWEESREDGHYRRKTMSSTTRSTALALSALVQIRPGHELEQGIVRWLMSQRKQQGWGTTNETSYAILALTDHLLATSFSEGATATGYTVWLNGAELASGSLGRGEPAVTLEIPAAQMAAGRNEIRVTQTGNGRLYYTLNNRVYLAQEKIGPAGVIGIERAYLDENGEPLETAVPGQLLQVRLRVTLLQDAAYVIVEDKLPGGLEALNERLNTTSHVASAEWVEPEIHWQQYGYNYKEVRGDRVSFFITEMDQGAHTFTYMARATHAGEFVSLPAEAYPMYDLATWGRSASSHLTISE